MADGWHFTLVRVILLYVSAFLLGGSVILFGLQLSEGKPLSSPLVIGPGLNAVAMILLSMSLFYDARARTKGKQGGSKAT